MQDFGRQSVGEGRARQPSIGPTVVGEEGNGQSERQFDNGLSQKRMDQVGSLRSAALALIGQARRHGFDLETFGRRDRFQPA